MRTRLLLVLLTVLVLPGPVAALPITTLTFEGGTSTSCVAGSPGALCQYAEQGYTLTALGVPPFPGSAASFPAATFEISGGALNNFPDFNDGIRFTRDDGGIFTLSDIDVLDVEMPMIFRSSTGAVVEFSPMEWFQRIQNGGSTILAFDDGWQNIPYFDFVVGEGLDVPVIVDNVRLIAANSPPALALVLAGLVVILVATRRPGAWRRKARGAR